MLERGLWVWPAIVALLSFACSDEEPKPGGGTGGPSTGAAAGTTSGGSGGTGSLGGGSGAPSGGTAGAAGSGGTGSLAGSGGSAGADASTGGVAGGALGGSSGASGSGGDASAEPDGGGEADAADVSVDTVTCTDADECPSATLACWEKTCSSGVCGTAPAAAGTPCTSGVCNGSGTCGACVPQSTLCVGNQLKTCDGAGQWLTPVACPYVCKSDKCSGVCVPGSDRCNGATVEVCGSDGEWKQSEVCSGSTPLCQDSSCEPTLPPSCQSLGKTCGKNANGYCCATSALPAGSFNRSYDAVTFNDPSYPATVSGFRLEQYEVTVGRFRAFVKAGQGTSASPPGAGAGAHPSVTGSGWQPAWNSSLLASMTALETALKCDATFATWTDVAGANDSRPINCVTWYEAFAFCAWDGARLPTEAEWNYAASGGSEHRLYPWSSPPTSPVLSPAQASYYVDGADQCMGDGVAGCTISDLVSVGAKPTGRGRWMSAELAGNVWEWVLDAYSNPYAISPCANCAVLGGTSRVIRGGSFFGTEATIRSSNRSVALPSKRLFSVGIRCARGT